ncbi:hypothetical protein M0802_011361 [Mischocyttarus mexicanus]|nr:hypothetical protein M0802_011361 [Mischocyttarus mexicanus]
MTPKCPVSIKYPFALPRESHCYSKFWKTIGVDVAWVVVVLVLRNGIIMINWCSCTYAMSYARLVNSRLAISAPTVVSPDIFLNFTCLGS